MRSLGIEELRDRIGKLESELSSLMFTRRIRSGNVDEIEKFYEECVERGNEGIIAKNLESKYHPGERGKDWLKLKKAGETLDFVVTRAEYGHGKRHKWLSDYYLAAYDENEREFKEIGKTYKGLTDEEIREMTKKLEKLRVSESGRTLKVEPKIVLEVEYSNIFSGESSSYDAGYSLRFARIKGIREDLNPEDASTLSKVSELAESEK
ncbi:hypothetical protein AKJ58_00900 [candidate division MSBL1 archaeon SCGC-AAA385D11]|uniref:ATP-dependent DNA ligase family profile domain-containing protein n=1 Tax=candidate division MSBL1 archaeon SCGC-AAA385D11 TaxID=1698286 RepID=A0A133VNS1_9EURY|nr:hypothetical protein AKJ58_00900 [candidate division MSBL1 archaeon SCGC-AAA385D11]